MSLNGYTTIQTQEIETVAAELSKRRLPLIDQFQPVADFEELYSFSEENPIPIELVDQQPAWRPESVAARVIEAIALAAHEPLNEFGWYQLAQILLEHTEYLFTYPEAPTPREKLNAGAALALASCIAASLPQSELWRLAGFGRIAATLVEVSPAQSDTHVVQPIEAAFLLADILNLSVLESAITCYQKVLNKNYKAKNILVFPLSELEFFKYLNFEKNGLENVKSAYLKTDLQQAKSEYSLYRQQYIKNFEDMFPQEKADTFITAKSYIECLLQMTIYPSPSIFCTTEVGIATFLFPELLFCEQLLTLASRRYKWIVDSFFYRDGFHKDRSLKSLMDAIADFTRFLLIYDKVKDQFQFQWTREIETLLDKQLEAGIFMCQPDLSFPPIDVNAVELGNIMSLNRKDFQYIGTSRDSGSKPKILSYVLADTGYHIMRDSWEPEAQYLLFDSGAIEKPFSESTLSFVLYANERQLITHNMKRERKIPNSECNPYNIILIDGKRQSSELNIVSEPGTRWISNATFDFVEAWYKTSDYHHKRSIFYVKGEYFILHDLILGDGEHSVEQLFHLNTIDEKFIDTQNAGQVWTREPGQSNLFLGYVDPINLNNTKINDNCLSFQSRYMLPTAINIVLFPMKPNSKLCPKVEAISVDADPDVLATGFTVECNGTKDVFLISDDGFAAMSTSDTAKDIEFKGEFLFLRSDKFVLFNGMYLKVGNRVLSDLKEAREFYMQF